MMKFNYVVLSDHVVSVRNESGIELGQFFKDVDGYYYFDWTLRNNGAYSQFTLVELARKIVELNKPYDEELEKFFKENLSP